MNDSTLVMILKFKVMNVNSLDTKELIDFIVDKFIKANKAEEILLLIVE